VQVTKVLRATYNVDAGIFRLAGASGSACCIAEAMDEACFLEAVLPAVRAGSRLVVSLEGLSRSRAGTAGVGKCDKPAANTPSVAPTLQPLG
jgi:hypothetical protein